MLEVCCVWGRLEVCGSSLFWNLLPVAGVGIVACQGFLVGRAFSVFCWVVLDLVGGAETSSELGFSVGMETFG